MAITTTDFLAFCERTIDGYTRALDTIDDSVVNETPDLPGANSPYRLCVHAFAACLWWVDHLVCGHPSTRVRDAEFAARGSIADCTERAHATKARLRQLAPEIAAATELQFPAETQTPLEAEWTVGAALIHAYEELAQHLGHLEVTVDVLIAADR